MNLNVLMISIDSTLAEDKDDVVGNAKARHIEYAKYVENLYIVVKTSKDIKCKVKKIKDNLFIYPTSSLNRYTFLCDAYNIAAKICKENRIDLICTQDPFITGLIGWLLKKKYNIPLNIQIYADMIDNRYFIGEAVFNLFLNLLAKQLIRKADAIRVTNSKEREKLAKLGIRDKKIWHMPVFVDLDFFSQNNGEDIKRYYLSDKFNRLVLFVGRLTKQKDVDTLIQAAPIVISQYPKVLFLIIGKGPEEKRIKNLISKLGIKDNVRLIGNISYDKLPEHFSACDIFVITSLYEGVPMALLEAAASGKPIISTPHTGASDTIEDGRTGCIVSFREPEAVAERILYLLSNPDVSRKMGRRGQELILSRFEKDGIIERYIRMWNDTCSSKI